MIAQLPAFAAPSYTALISITDVVYKPGQTAILPNGTMYEWTGTAWVMVGVAGAMATYETSANGFDPSTGRTPIEECNNYAQYTLKTGVFSGIIKGAPGFLQSVQITGFGTIPANVYAMYYDNATAASGSLVGFAKVDTTGKTEDHLENVLFTAGLTVGLATADASGVFTAITSGTLAYAVTIALAVR